MRAFVVLLLVALAAPADAFQIESLVTPSCHEDVTAEAVRRAGFPGEDAPPPSETQARALDDLTFTLPRGDVWMAALLVGVRSNDIRDFAPSDLAGLVSVHNDPADQGAHCLRGPRDDGLEGDLGALATCRAFVLGELEAGGLLAETLDLAAEEDVRTYLAFRGAVSVPLPRFAYRLGRALHAIEDAFTHAMRDPDTGAATHVLNWVDYVRDGFDADVDGYPHISALDDCRRDDPRERRRVERATAAAAAILAAIADPAPGRRARVEAAVDAALVHQAGCDATNDYCDAEELDEEASVGCAAVQPALLVALVLIALRRRRASALGLALGLALASPEARADWHLDARQGLASDNAATATAVGLSRDLLGRWRAGVALEWNPWFSLDSFEARPGAINAYATLARTWFANQDLAIYSRAELGTSTVLFELVGVDRFSTGVYFGGSLLGIRIPLSRCAALTFDPSHFAMPTPHLVGLPFYYKQYRITVGLDWTLP